MADQRRSHVQSPLTPLDELTSRLDEVVLNSPADETEVVCLEIERGQAAHNRPGIESQQRLERTVLVRVRERGRESSFRIGTCRTSEVAAAVRNALAHARGAEPTSPARLPNGDQPPATSTPAFDRHLAELDPDQASRLLAQTARDADESACLSWLAAHVVVCNSHALRRSTAVTGVSIDVGAGNGAGAGFAARSSRTLADLEPSSVFDRARATRGGGRAADLPKAPVPVLLAPEVTIALLELLNQIAFSATAYRDGASLLRQHSGVQVFDRRIALRDDATSSLGLCFPFDLEGSTKQPTELIVDGAPRTPALDTRTARDLGREPTGHSLTGNEAWASNLFMAPGEASDQELLEHTDGGVWFGRLKHLECIDPSRVTLRAHVGSVRAVRGGQLAEALPDLVWEDSLLHAFSSLIAVGSRTVVWSPGDVLLGATSAPPVAIGEISDLRPV